MSGNSNTPAFWQDIPKSSYEHKNSIIKSSQLCSKREKGFVIGVTWRSAVLSLKQVHIQPQMVQSAENSPPPPWQAAALVCRDYKKKEFSWEKNLFKPSLFSQFFCNVPRLGKKHYLPFQGTVSQAGPSLQQLHGAITIFKALLDSELLQKSVSRLKKSLVKMVALKIPSESG